VLVLAVSPVRIDVLTDLEGLTFAAAWRRRVEATFGEERALYISLTDLVRVKEIADRPIDREDVRLLRRVLARRDSS
jgi:siroheme synthase (precorrin-2 oxidase/ferrochelatase)